ncbi:MAG: asparaginase [Rhodoferax sp.]|nr:asparaginase [Rhodoferax sp.]
MAEKLVFLGMGGTIAGTASSKGDNVGYTAAQLGVEALLASVPGLQAALGGCHALAEQVCQIDSKDLQHEDWLALARRVIYYLAQADIRGIVVTHGTDTLEETAYFLHRALPATLHTKPLVLTCAMRPASSLTPDGPTNLADAVQVALMPQAQGVMVVCAGKIHAASQVQKVHPYRVDAFDSGEAGPVGVVEEGRVRLLGHWPQPDTALASADLDALQQRGWPRVELLFNHAGASGALVRALLQTTGGDAPLAGIVVAGTGNGSIHRLLEAALRTAQSQGVRVVRVSRCAYGHIVLAGTGSRSGEWEAYALSAAKARIALMLDIAAAG